MEKTAAVLCKTPALGARLRSMYILFVYPPGRLLCERTYLPFFYKLAPGLLLTPRAFFPCLIAHFRDSVYKFEYADSDILNGLPMNRAFYKRHKPAMISLGVKPVMQKIRPPSHALSLDSSGASKIFRNL